ncbi:MAG: hypothetical protein ACR2H3_00130 [Acidimicrobiales bacterium]
MSLELLRLGVQPDERVRFKRPDQARWQTGRATGVEKDGSLSITDAKGASRAMPLQQVEVQVVTARGAKRWEPLIDRASRSEQLKLL